MSKDETLKKFTERRATVAVIGLGYVGLPLAVAFAEAGFRAIGLDIDKPRVDILNTGESYISDIPSEVTRKLVLETKTLMATTNFDALLESDAVIICVPTPLSKTKDPDLSFVISAVDEIAARLHPDMLIVMESTTYPGTTEELILPRLEMASDEKLIVGEDFYLAFSPERIDPGRKDWTVYNTPKVIGGQTPTCLEVATTLYGQAIETVVPVSSPRAAEIVKLLENTFRAVNIALVNEVAIMCDRLDIEVWEVIEAAKTKPFGFMPFYPGPGLGGHCIPIDPEYLAWKLKTLNYNARFIQLAAEVNFGMPEYVLEKITEALNDRRKALNGSKFLVLGVAYKENVSDLRESPALDVIHLLQEKRGDVMYHDPYVPVLNEDGISLTSVTLNETILRDADCVVITTAHSSYDWEWIVENSRLVFDTRNATRNIVASADKLVKL